MLGIKTADNLKHFSKKIRLTFHDNLYEMSNLFSGKAKKKKKKNYKKQQKVNKQTKKKKKQKKQKKHEKHHENIPI